MVASGGQPPEIETAEDDLLEEIRRLEALMIIYRQHLFNQKCFFLSQYDSPAYSSPARQEMKLQMANGVTVLPTPCRSNGGTPEIAAPDAETVPALLPSPKSPGDGDVVGSEQPVEQPTLEDTVVVSWCLNII